MNLTPKQLLTKADTPEQRKAIADLVEQQKKDENGLPLFNSEAIEGAVIYMIITWHIRCETARIALEDTPEEDFKHLYLENALESSIYNLFHGIKALNYIQTPGAKHFSIGIGNYLTAACNYIEDIAGFRPQDKWGLGVADKK